MSRKILVIGGTRYFGKRLVELLIKNGDQVTTLTRGQVAGSKLPGIERLEADRGVEKELAAVVKGRNWDIVYDQMCYSPTEAAAACRIFETRVGRYIHTSTQSVYEKTGSQRESDFNPTNLPLKMGTRADFDYGESKRLAEAVYAQKAKFPFTALRLPIVLGPDDYTGRLEFHIDRIRNGRPIVIANPKAETSFISSVEAANFLLWTGQQTFTGPLNACSEGHTSVPRLLVWAEETLGKQALIVREGPEKDITPMVGNVSTLLDATKATHLGFSFKKIEEWLPPLIREIAQRPRDA